MDSHRLRELLLDVRRGSLKIADAEARLAELPFAEMGFAKLDHHRHLRCGMAEVVFGSGKRIEDLLAILERARQRHEVVLATRLSEEQMRAVAKRFPGVHRNERARTARVGCATLRLQVQPVAVVTAGTSDIPVAEEARETLEAFGCPSRAVYDVGVAGIHRLLHTLPEIRTAPVVIAVAGMEGALPSVVGGLVGAPVVAVPTSIGYGASFGGVAALLGMLNTCAAGVTVVNIDNGFGAAAAALRMLNSAAKLGHAQNGRRASNGDPRRARTQKKNTRRSTR
ncbi:MAG: nickel pincer cofactor biosynthesis protein LarB [Planctomycetes bacterium]|nr:nickel pincer cofactor biosynthesis protein LarB [Planctomycetota bacterium]